mgnify:CR=1 FL=1
MSQDPMYKGRGPIKFDDPIPKSQGLGYVDVSKDYSSSFSSLRARITYMMLCLLPYAGFCVFIYLEGLSVLFAILLIIPTGLFGLFWFLKKKLKH